MTSPARYRKKPVEIEAWQLKADGENSEEEMTAIASWCGGSYELDGDDSIYISTLEGTMTASPGDWIICGVKGEFYPCKPDVFAATYEPVSS
jgi:hypothetical protein